MDDSVWSILEKKVSGKRYATVEAVKGALRRSWDNMTVEQCASIVGNICNRVRKCIKAEEDYFDYLLYLLLFNTVDIDLIIHLLIRFFFHRYVKLLCLENGTSWNMK